MVRNNRLQIVLILLFFMGVIVFTQDKAVNEDQKLREEILAVYKAEGERGLRDFVKKKKDRIPNKFIIEFAQSGRKERNEEWLKICEIMAEEKKDEKNLADVLFQTGKYFGLISDNKKAVDYFGKALPIYKKLNDWVGQGNIYLGRGVICFYTGDISRAKEMYDKALQFFKKSGDPFGQGNVYLRMGYFYLYTGNNSRAFDMYEKALPFFEKVKNQQGQANIYLGKGVIYLKIGNNSKALEMYDKALFFFEKAEEPLGQGNVYIEKGDIYFYTGENLKAFEMYDKALPFFEKAGTPIGQGNVYSNKGDICSIIGDYSKALMMYDKALPFFEKAKSIISQGNIYWRKGDIYSIIGEKPKALEMYDKALYFFEKAREPIGQGNVYNSKGDIYLNTGDSSKALEMYDRALLFFEISGSIIGKGEVYLRKGKIYFYTGDNSRAFEMYDKALFFSEKAGDPIGQGNVYWRKGQIYFYTGDNSKALEMYEKALPFFEKAGTPLGQGNVHQYKGDIYMRTGNNSRALEMYDKALLFFEKAKYPLGQGNIYSKKGDIYLIIGDNSRAKEMCDKALQFFKKSGDPLGQGNVYLNKGDIYLKTRDNSRAREMYDKALPFFEKAEDQIGQGNVYWRKGKNYFYIGDNSKALDMYENALHFFEKVGDIESESIVLQGKAKVLSKQGKKDKALALFEKGLANLEKVRKQTEFSEMKRTLMEKVYTRYEEAVTFMLENKYYQKGFKYAESMKSRVLLDKMAEELVRLEKGLTPNLKEKRDNLVAKFSSLSKQIHETSSKDEKKLQELKEQYRKTGNEFDELLIKIRLENPLYASVRYPEPITVIELQKEVLKKGEILVRYFISPGKLYVFLVSKKKFKVVPLEVKKEELEGLAEEHLHAVKENNPIRMKRYGKILYEKIFKPLEKRIKKSKDIIIVPDGELATIPFESLIVDNKGQAPPVFLLEKYRVKYLQSASLLKILRQHYQKDRETNSFIGFGDPVYDYENFKLGKPEHGSIKILATESTEGTESIEDTRSDTKENRFSSESSESSVSSVAKTSPQAFGDEIKEIHRDRYARAGGIMDRLQASGEEVKTIARLFEKKSQKSVVHLRDKATEDNAGAPGMKDFDYIHFTCHGLLNDDFQSLVLSQLPPDKSKEDGYFTLNEIMNCDYNAKLVVLSACQTGSGKLERAEGVTGMTRAVMYAGTPAVAASLWKVDDEATKELMINFYQNLLEKNLDKAEALRQAKLALIKNKKYRSPLFWSAFVLYGE